MSDDAKALEQNAEGDPSAAIVKRADGIYFHASAPAAACLSAASQVFLGSAYFAGLDYAVFTKMLYNCGPDLPESLRNKPLLRFADSIESFHAPRRALYKTVKIINGEAEYYFEPVYFEVPDMPPTPARLNSIAYTYAHWVVGKL